jgi:4,5-dihydroxyphthalate decarboxylase
MPIALDPEETFHRAFKAQEFDICEISLSSHTLNIARGTAKYVAVPAFLSRAFRHSGIYIRSDRGIRTPEDLRGKKIGIPEYQITANVWIRGLLMHEYGVYPHELLWRRGGLEEPGRQERSPINLPSNIDVQQLPADLSLSDALARGDIDAVFSAKAPSCFLNGHPGVQRLFPDFRPVEMAYYQKTKLFPTMHVVGIRASLAEKYPWLCTSVFKAFLQAKAIAIQELSQIGHFGVTLPWGVAEMQASQALMGEDFWSYGYEANRHVLDTFMAYHHEQGISNRLVNSSDLFSPSTLEMAKN